MYEGTPDTPHQGRFWEIVEKYGRHDPLHGADRDPHVHEVGRRHPGEVRPVVAAGARLGRRADQPRGVDLVPQAHRRRPRPIVDTWWQTETGAIMISPLPGVTATKPGSAMTALPGISATSSTTRRERVPNGGGGYLVLTEPWPSMLRTIWGDDQRFLDTYWSRFEGKYFAGDGAKKDDDGDIWLLGRVDDVMNVSGHRISTTEVESALVSHPSVAEAAVVGAADETTGQAIVAFVILRGTANAETRASSPTCATTSAKEIGPIAKPRRIMPVAELPKTRSGKIMRRLLRDVAENRELGDVTTLPTPR
jgi:acetyl-CoA synthetase